MSAPALTIAARIPGDLSEAVSEKLRAAAQADVAARVRAADATLWGPEGAPEIGDRLGWIDIVERMLAQVEELEDFAREVCRDRVADVVLLGMGGSSLAPEVLRRCFEPAPGHPRLHVLDSTDAGAVRAVGESVELQRTLFLVSSKSGGTIEPLSLFAHFHSLLPRGECFAAITDPGTSLEALAREHGFRRVFAGDPAIGGRFSALSPFGMVPAALLGLDLRALLERARGAWSTPGPEDGGPSAPGPERGASAAGQGATWIGAALSALAGAGRDKLTFVISDSLPGLGLWLEQLVAESTGKQGKGILPVAEEPLGSAEDYGEDRVFAHIPDLRAPVAALEQHLDRLAEAGHPVITVPAEGSADLGRLFALWEIAVAVAGWGLAINPFDQPNVQQAKDATKRVLERFEQTGELEQAADASAEELEQLLDGASPPEYVAIMAYAGPSAGIDAASGRLRAQIRARTRATTTFGYGPRFLHSTGQFHKGGPRRGRFLQLLHDSPPDVEIPGAPYGFTTLKNAQAAGDLSTLRELGLDAARVRLHGADPAQAMLELASSLERKARSIR